VVKQCLGVWGGNAEGGEAGFEVAGFVGATGEENWFTCKGMVDKTPPQSGTSLRRSTSPTWEVKGKRVTQQVSWPIPQAPTWCQS
jgi:hypothetical protein